MQAVATRSIQMEAITATIQVSISRTYLSKKPTVGM